MLKTENCRADCGDQNYILRVGHVDFFSWTSFEIINEGIVTSMRLFYKHIVLPIDGKIFDNGDVFAGV